jgi:3(or 17)beta-hydroxysteroid dehydrogenase
MGRVQDKVALITGGASGIGLATAQLFADEGARVILTDLSPPSFKSAVAAHKLDVTREDEWIAVTDGVVRDLGRIDILVNSAGVSLLKDIAATTLDEWRALMAVNLDGTFLGCKHAVRVMKDRGGGAIVNMSSVAGIVGTSHLPAYSASKGGVRLLTKSVALHCARKGYNIRCNSVHPSFADTPMLQAMVDSASGETCLELCGSVAAWKDRATDRSRPHDSVSRQRRVIIHYWRRVRGRWRPDSGLKRLDRQRHRAVSAGFEAREMGSRRRQHAFHEEASEYQLVVRARRYAVA